MKTRKNMPLYAPFICAQKANNEQPGCICYILTVLGPNEYISDLSYTHSADDPDVWNIDIFYSKLSQELPDNININGGLFDVDVDLSKESMMPDTKIVVTVSRKDAPNEEGGKAVVRYGDIDPQLTNA